MFAALDDERVWATGYGGGPAGRWPDVDAARLALERFDQGTTGPRQAWVVRLAADSELGAAGTVVGHQQPRPSGTWSTSGCTWAGRRTGPPWWAGPVNPACKLALLGHAFDDCGFGRVKLQTDLINTRSQAAIAKLGATREGVLRRHVRRADGSWRDSVVFSILRDEWPAVRARLEQRLTG